MVAPGLAQVFSTTKVVGFTSGSSGAAFESKPESAGAAGRPADRGPLIDVASFGFEESVRAGGTFEVAGGMESACEIRRESY